MNENASAASDAWAEPSGYADAFCREHLPPTAALPFRDYSGLPELAYPPRLNCAGELLDGAIERGFGERVAFRFAGGCWTYGELLANANRIARVLVEDLGLESGNRVLLRGFNAPMTAACWFGILKAGGVVVCTMPLLRAREIAYIVAKARIDLALTDARLLADCEQGMAAAGGDGRSICYGGGGESGTLEAWMAGKSAAFANCDTAAEDIALIAFTSGTTGDAKGTMHAHRDVLAICDCFPPQVLRPTADDLFIGSPPFAFTYGLGGIVLFPLRIGAAAVLLEQASPPNLIRGIAEYGATICFTAPTAYRAMLPLLAEHDIATLRACVSAGETLPLATFEAWQRATGLRIIDGIGSTEILHIFISASGDDIRPGSTGKVVPGYRARIVDEQGAEVRWGTIGRLAIQGPTGCRYLDDPVRQRAYVLDGWNLTGDTYLQDDDGYFWYQARNDDMIVSSGYNISGPEVENALLDHPSVQECGVVGVPDPERGQVVKAFVVLRPGFLASAEAAQELQSFVKREIAPYKYPRQLEFVAALPRTLTGKLQRFQLREREGGS
jgi:2-aminobenzoate-CoA ligase